MGSTEVDMQKPLVSLEWQDVTVTATVLGVSSTPALPFNVFPKFDEKLPYRRGIKAPLSFAKLSNVNVVSKAIKSAGSSPNESAVAADGKTIKKCHICGRGFNKATYLKRHILSHSNVKPFKCKICSWGFFQYSNLKRHMTSHAANGQTFKCSYCPASFSTKSVLSVHTRDAHSDKTPPTQNVAPKTSSLLLLPSSASSSSPSPNSNNSQPTNSPPTFPDGVSLLKISRENRQKSPVEENDESTNKEGQNGEQVRLYSCTICQAKFEKVSFLNKHIRVHGVNPLS